MQRSIEARLRYIISEAHELHKLGVCVAHIRQVSPSLYIALLCLLNSMLVIAWRFGGLVVVHWLLN
jgi:hypothetical protein